ncbi:MAG: stage V sporulation protein AB [Lachnospira sp.]|nr:stage V sporulation protein AB [Lachnospira sp.]
MTEILHIAALAFFGVAAGALTSAGFFAIITAVGLINRVAAVTKTTDKLLLYEEIIIIGAVAGTVLSVFDVSPARAVAGIGDAAVIFILMLIGVLAGMYVGLFVVSLAETAKALPIFIRRVRIGAGLGIVILMIGLGKAVGQLIYYFVLYV